MTPGRNAPCPCGSGRKYKHCHAAQDAAEARSPRLQLLRNTSAPARQRLQAPPAHVLTGAWQVEVAPMPGVFENDPAARTVLVMLVAGGFVLAAEMENRPSEEPDALAALMAREVLAAAAHSGVTPPEVTLRHQRLLEPLHAMLAPHGILVRLDRELRELDEALRHLLGHMFHGIVSRHQMRSTPETWAGWGLPPALVTRCFVAAAEFREAAPWQIAGNERPIRVSQPGGPEWSCVVLGGAGQQTGLACYENAADLERLFAGDEDAPHQALRGLDGTVLSLLFNTRAELPRRMREEIKAARWPVAAPDAYPTLVVLNTPGGGVRQAHFALLCDALESVPRFVAAHPEAFRDDTAHSDEVRWTDPATGLTCRLDALMPVFTDVLSLEHRLTPCLPEGAGATPDAVVSEDEADEAVASVLQRYVDWLEHPPSGRVLKASTIHRHASTARLLLEFCVHYSGRPVSVISEYDLWSFLHDWYPRKVWDTERHARDVPGSLRRFFAFLAEREQLVCPWALPLLRDADSFMAAWRVWRTPRSAATADADAQAISNLYLLRRVLIPESELIDGLTFGDTMGHEEHTLYQTLHRLWLQWRDELVRSGVTDPRAVYTTLRARQRAWAATPSDGRLSTSTPVAVIRRERKAMQAAMQRLGKRLDSRRSR